MDVPSVGGAPIRFLVAMPWGRVGSNLLMGILGRSADPGRIRLASEELTVHPDWDADAQLAWLARHYALDPAADPASPITHIGAKEAAVAVRDPARFSAACAEGGIRIVRLRRANLVKSAVSQVRARDHADVTGRWSVTPDEPPPGPSHIDPVRLRAVIDTMAAADRTLMTMFAGCAIHDVEYADLIDDLEGTVRGVRDFLAIGLRPYRVPHAKMTPDDLRTAIVNFAEVAAALRDTPYAGQLEA
ncbi:MAG: hypothetical protein ACKOTZ_13725 [Chloroflexota bacterium]